MTDPTTDAATATQTSPDGFSPTRLGPLRSVAIFNPARVEDIDDRRAVVDGALAEAGWPATTWVETTEDDPGLGQARKAVADGAEVVFVCGGDGTVRACVEGLAGTRVALAVLPAGTGNLLATNLGLPDDPAAGVQMVVEGGRRRIDIGEVDGHAFAVMAGMGFDAVLLDDASTTLKAKLGPVAYVLSAIRHLRDPRMTVRITVDDHAPVRRRARTVVVGNVGRLQGGVPLFADAEPDNGLLDVAIVGPRGVGEWVRLAWDVVRHRRDVVHMQVLRGADITIVSEREQARELDGDVIDPGTTLRATVRPGALELCVPQPEQSHDLAEGSEHLEGS
jgi:diacylglycerol kinase (ATP)